MALRATVYLSLLGKAGLREVAELCVRKAHYAAERLADSKSVKLAFPQRPFFKEFLLRVRTGASAAVERARTAGFDIGPALDRYPAANGSAHSDCVLVAVTERRTREEIDSLVEALQS
jgi:glycine dehydrogenase subunit 1